MSLELARLFRGELLLTVNVVLGLVLGKLLVSSGVLDKALNRWLPFLSRLGIPPIVVIAIGTSVGSSRAGSATIAAAYDEGQLNRDEAMFGTLCLSFPAYCRRWITTVSLSVSLAGRAGFIYALILLCRSFCRFLISLRLLTRRGKSVVKGDKDSLPDIQLRSFRIIPLMKRTLPLAWAFYGLAFWATPHLSVWIQANLRELPLLPSAGLTVALSSLAHNAAALAAAGGSLASSTLSCSQAVLALLLGNALGMLQRSARTQFTFWIGIFPRDLFRSLLFWYFAILLPLVLISIVGTGFWVFLEVM